MLKFFQNKNPLMFVFYIIISISIVLILPTNTVNDILTVKHTFLYNQILQLLSGKYFITFYKIFLVLMLIVNTILYNKLLISIKLFKSNNTFSGFIFLVLVSIFAKSFDVLQILFSTLFLLSALKVIFSTLRKSNAVFEYLNTGLLFSISFLFWETTLYYFILIFLSILILRIQNWHEWIASLIGLFLPIFISSSIYFFINSNFDVIFETYSLLFLKSNTLHLSVFQLVALVFVFGLSAFSIFKILVKFNSLESNNQDYYKILISVFFIALVVTFLFPSNLYGNFVFGIIGLSVPIIMLFTTIRNKIISEVLFDIFLILIVISVLL